MPVNILMPSMSPTMTQGTITKWLKKEGDAVESGDVLAEIETDKATMELEAVESGKLAKILHGAGSESVPVHEPIAILLSEGEDESALKAVAAEPKPAAPPAPKPVAAKPVAAPAKPPATPAQKPVVAKPLVPPAKPVAAPARLFASPLAKRIAGERGIDLNRVQGSGPRGRIVVRDIEGVAPGAKRPPAPALPGPLGEAPYVETSLSTMRKIIAERMSLSKREAPHFYLTIDCEVDALVKGRAELNASLAQTPEGGEQEEPPSLTLNDFLIRAAALALVKVPEANVAYVDGKLRQYSRADIAVAVAVPGGLVTPIVFDAANKGLGQIAAEMRALTARAKQAKLMAEEYQGGTFTISNLGMFGIRAFAAVLNPPQACLLAVGRAEKRAVVKDDAVVPATMMTCTLSIDHRAVDGAIGARWLSEFKRLVEQPLAMLL
ncbi:MAG: pyruvate dehydrogenase complex dihydrolipoamide acetyltransferase [Alphaproteobacteria bacterium]